jgi:hypothetical protein
MKMKSLRTLIFHETRLGITVDFLAGLILGVDAKEACFSLHGSILDVEFE